VASLSGIGAVLARRNMRIFYGGSFTSWTGLWVQQVATDWLAWQLTHSPLWVAICAFCNLAPSVIVSPFAGAVADRMDRVHLTMTTQLITAVHAATLATLTYTGVIRIEYMAGLAALLGMTQAVAQPARQSMVPGMVPRGELPGAVALNSLCYNLARSVGPGIGGVIVATWGVVPAMVVNCCGYVFASVTMSALRLDEHARRGHAPTGSVIREAFEGIVYVVRHPGMGPLFLYAAVVGVLVRAVPEMLPPFVAQLFGRGAEGLATLSSAIGLAALVGGLTVALHARLTGLVRYAVVSGTIVALATGGFVATHSFFFAVVCACVMGGATTVHGISIQTLLQSATAGHMIGRVISLWGMLTRVTPAIGTLAYGAASEVAGLQAPVLLGALLAVGACILAARRLPSMAQSLEFAEA